MKITEIRKMNANELDLVSGGAPNLNGMVYCVGEGVKVPGGCTPTYGDLITVVQGIVEKGRQIQQQYGGGGRPS